MAAEFTWRIPPEQVLPRVFDNYSLRIRQAVETVMLRRAPEIEAWMKTNAPWTDRTGNARQTLHTQVVAALTEIALLMAHGMDYGISLETVSAGAYAIVGPACDHFAPIIMDDLRSLGLRIR